MVTKKEGLEKLIIRVPAKTKEWYVKECSELGMSLSQYISFLLVTHQRNQESAQTLKNLSDMTKDEELKQQNHEIIEMMKSPDYQEMFKALMNQSANRTTRRTTQKKLPKG